MLVAVFSAQSKLEAHPLPGWLGMAVPLHLLDLKERSGPDEADLHAARAFSKTLGERGDVLLFGSKKQGEAAKLANDLAHAIAVLAYCPGGITIFGQHWESRR